MSKLTRTLTVAATLATISLATTSKEQERSRAHAARPSPR